MLYRKRNENMTELQHSEGLLVGFCAKKLQDELSLLSHYLYYILHGGNVTSSPSVYCRDLQMELKLPIQRGGSWAPCEQKWFVVLKSDSSQYSSSTNKTTAAKVKTRMTFFKGSLMNSCFCPTLLFLCSDGVTGSSLGARMLQGGVKKGLLLRNMQVEWAASAWCQRPVGQDDGRVKL